MAVPAVTVVPGALVMTGDPGAATVRVKVWVASRVMPFSASTVKV
jgi:hypothetical protein